MCATASGIERNIQLKRGPAPIDAVESMRFCVADMRFLMRYRPLAYLSAFLMRYRFAA
jgi:hypothetical protein